MRHQNGTGNHITIVWLPICTIVNLKIKPRSSCETDTKYKLSNPEDPINPKICITVGLTFENCIFKMATILDMKIKIQFNQNTSQTICHTSLKTNLLKMRFSRWPPGAILDLKVEINSNQEMDFSAQNIPYIINHTELWTKFLKM